MVESHKRALKNAGFSDSQIEALASVFMEDEAPAPYLWDNVKFFDRKEFACKCGGKYCDGFPVEPASNLVYILDRIRDEAGAACIITSGIRCNTHNANVGGVANSWHKKGFAADFMLTGKTAAQTIAIAKKYSEHIVELYAIDNTHVHIAVK